MFIELAIGIDDEALDEAAPVADTPDRPKVHTRAGANARVCQGVSAWPYRDVAAALRSIGTNMPVVHNTQRASMNATFRSIVDEMTVAEQTTSTGTEKQQLVIQALTAAGWVDDNNRSEVMRYINLVAWIAKRPELLVAINAGVKRASSKCCIAV